MREYFHKIIFLLDKDLHKIPWLVILFLFSSLLDLAGLGLIAPYLGLILDQNSQPGGLLHKLLESFGLEFEKNSLLILLGQILMIIFLFKACIAIFINREIAVFSNQQQVQLKSFLMQAYQEMPYANFLKRNSAEYIISIQSHTGSYAAVLQICLKTLSELFMASVILTFLAFTNGPALGLLVILLIVMVFGYDRLFRIKVRNYGERSNKASVRMVQGIHEGIEGLKEIRILGKEHYFQEVVHKNALEVAENQVKTLVISSSPRYLLEFILITFFVSLVAGSILIGQDLKSLIPTLGIFGIAALRIMPSANQFSSSMIQLRSMSHSISVLYDDIRTLKKTKID